MQSSENDVKKNAGVDERKEKKILVHFCVVVLWSAILWCLCILIKIYLKKKILGGKFFFEKLVRSFEMKILILRFEFENLETLLFLLAQCLSQVFLKGLEGLEGSVWINFLNVLLWNKFLFINFVN